MGFDRRLVQYFDWGLMLLIIVLGAFGLVALYSAVTAGADIAQRILFTKQLIWYSAGLVAMIDFFYSAINHWKNGPILFMGGAFFSWLVF